MNPQAWTPKSITASKPIKTNNIKWWNCSPVRETSAWDEQMLRSRDVWSLRISQRPPVLTLNQRNHLKTFSPPPDIWQTAHICLHESKHICAAMWTLPTANPSPATLLGWSDSTSWIHGILTSVLRCMNSDPAHAPFFFVACALRLLCSWRLAEQQAAHKSQLAEQQPFCYSLSAHTPQCKWGRDRMETARVGESAEMPGCACVCVWCRKWGRRRHLMISPKA